MRQHSCSPHSWWLGRGWPGRNAFLDAHLSNVLLQSGPPSEFLQPPRNAIQILGCPRATPPPPHDQGALSDGVHVTLFWDTVAPLLFPPASGDLGPYFVLEPASLCQRPTVWRNDVSSHVGEKSWQQLRETPEHFSLKCILIVKELSEWKITEMPLAGGGQRSLQDPRS